MGDISGPCSAADDAQSEGGQRGFDDPFTGRFSRLSCKEPGRCAGGEAAWRRRCLGDKGASKLKERRVGPFVEDVGDADRAGDVERKLTNVLTVQPSSERGPSCDSG